MESLYRWKNYTIELPRPAPEKNIAEENALQWTIKAAPGSENIINYTVVYSNF